MGSIDCLQIWHYPSSKKTSPDLSYPHSFPTLNSHVCFQGQLHTCVDSLVGHVCSDRGALCLLWASKVCCGELLTLWRPGPRNPSVQEAGARLSLFLDTKGKIWKELGSLGPWPCGERPPPTACWVQHNTYRWTPAGFSFRIFLNTIWQAAECSWQQATTNTLLSS